MRRIAIWLVLVLVCAAVAQQPSTPPATQPPAMENYVMVFLRRPAGIQPLPKEEGEKLMTAHLANIRKLANEGKLVCAGPFLDGTPLRGLFVLKTDSIEAAKQWVATDPIVQAGRMVPDFHVWRQPAGTFSSPPESNPMQNYAFIIYLNGDKGDAAPALLQRHLAYLRSQKDAGKLVTGAPFRHDGSDLGGALIVAGTVDEGKEFAANDPLVQEGIVKPEVHPWMTQKGVLPR